MTWTTSRAVSREFEETAAISMPARAWTMFAL
jgi:hypothetical protein